MYARRAELGRDDRYDLWEPANLYMEQERERAVVALLRRHGYLPLGDRRVLDVGSGSGQTLMNLLNYGARPANLFGVDLLEDRVAGARELNPHLNFEAADATRLPYPDASFDLVLAFTLFSSIADAAARAEVASQMTRVLRPGGAVLSYDFWINPVNREVVPISRGELRRLFPGARIEARRVTLAPPLTRALARRAWLACDVLGAVPFLRTHWLALVRPHGVADRRTD